MATRTALLVASACALSLAAAGAQAADALDGRKVAERWCTSCHAVSPNSGGDSAPPFAAIANRPVFESEMLRLFLTKPHPPMPAMQLTRIEIDNLIAYLQTLRTAK